jgi:3-methyladenine DNA glycosylase AlkD
MKPTTDLKRLYAEIIHQLTAAADPETQAKMQRAVPGARILGVSVPTIRQQVLDFRQAHPQLTLEETCALMDEFCQSRGREEMLFGIFLLGRFGKRVNSLSWSRLEPWLAALDNWEVCDQLASAVSGPLVAANLTLVDRLVELTASPNLWQRRFALATACELNHKGRAHPAETLRICLLLLGDREPMVRKAVGWALKEASKQRPEVVYAFLLEHHRQLHPSVLREAAEKLSDDQRATLLAL